MRVAYFLPEEVLHLGESAWRESAASYLGLEQELGGRRMLPAGPLEPVLRDYCSTVQLCGRLCPLYLASPAQPVSSSLSLCLNQIFPLMLQHESSELAVPLYRLLHHTLLYN